ncbi:hypothetical protein LTR37_008478 [Vermiconidia calcicola]|uniref:Uncharacterized protein n=1 Tax=Vermiconidia calcicola TaxID=1690605 RepID=A0ACC3NCE1_9PEZI|nr:hypothetical protein LTR37_008478 [Vermiconidia calcicola]
MADLPKANPPTEDILGNHELAHRTITQHNTDLAIFDDDQLAILKRFTLDPTPGTRCWVLENMCGAVVDPEGTPDEKIGRAVGDKGSLAGYVVARYGRVKDDRHTFYPSEIEALRKWFEGGGGGVAKL